ncbi:serine/threonine-protein kinase MRCK alpha-like isoform X2 [Apostichopus japonicus]|uniref:serine/threonine-protein kinase MRCK alpha-like isoform X2 n=1 Tax=Stichopus japonicus TaxID=307972 RepID=UPI003AB2D225
MSRIDVETRQKMLEKLYLNGVQESGGDAASMESLLDILLVLFDECCNSTLRREKSVHDFINWAKPLVARVRDLRLNRDDFETLEVIGRGAFGQVSVVKMKDTGEVFAMKLLNKWEMLKRAETACFIEERDVLVYGDSRWITNLHYAFQDEDYLYLVMDYYCGGDLLTLITKYEDRLPEEMAKFYIAEMVLAIDSIHQLRYVHRDIKPDNVLLDQNGHIRLADFGSCLKMLEDGTVQSKIAVGTPDYISPEILMAMEEGKGKYGPECDWWSLGVCMYEMLFGETPFYAEALAVTYEKIMNHKKYFEFPQDIDDVSDAAKELIRKLICPAAQRLGSNNLQEVRNHPFFEGIDWNNIRDMIPPYKPEVSNNVDTSNFDVDDTDLKVSDAVPPNTHREFTGNHLPFVGFTFTRNSKLSDVGSLIEAKDSVIDKDTRLDIDSYERKIKRLEAEKKEKENIISSLKLQLQDSSSPVYNGQLPLDKNREEQINKLQDEVTHLKKKLADSEKNSQGRILDGGDTISSIKVRELERKNRQFKAERDDIEKELEEKQTLMRQQKKDLKEAQSQHRLTQKEMEEVNNKYSELQLEKQKSSRLVKEKDEEIDNLMHQLDKKRQDLRKTEKLQKEHETELVEVQSELAREKRLRQQSDQYRKRLEEELEVTKIREVGKSSQSAEPSHELQSEVSKLRAELNRKDIELEDALAKAKSRHANEEQSLRDQIQENNQELEKLKRNLSRLQETSDWNQQMRSQEQLDLVSEIKRKYEREKAVLMEENKKARTDLEKNISILEKLQRDHRILQDEVQDITEKKDSVAHWEAQITEIIQWVNDEKEARGYLQGLATKMTDELESVRAPGPPGTGKANWQSRRSHKMDKMELLNLQSSLRSEVLAKEQLQKEMTEVSAARSSAESKLSSAETQITEVKLENEKLKERIKELEDKLESKQEVSSINRQDSTMNLDFFVDFLKSDVNVPPVQSDEESEMPKSNEPAVNEPPQPEIENKPVNNNKSPPRQVKPKVPPPMSPPKPKAHKLIYKDFSTPLKCSHCTSLMLGQMRQGMLCEVCNVACHVACAEKASSVCPAPADQFAKPQGIDPNQGIGTAIEGYLKIPRAGGVKKGWMRQFAVVCDFKFFLFDVIQGRNGQPINKVVHVLDMRDENFEVASVQKSEVFHADDKHIPCIFIVSASQLNPPVHKAQLLLLAENATEKSKWIKALTELRKIIQKNLLADRSVFRVKEVISNPPVPLPKVQCADIIDSNRFLLGTEDALWKVEITNEGNKATCQMTKLEPKRTFQVKVLRSEQLVVVSMGRNHKVHLYPISILEKSTRSVKLEDTRDCSMFTTGRIRQGSTTGLCVAVKQSICVYEFNMTKNRHRKIRDIAVGKPVQCLQIVSERLCVGFQTGFTIFGIEAEGQQQLIVVDEDPDLAQVVSTPMDAQCVIEISNREFLLCFARLGVYVDHQGKKSRKRELMWPSLPTSICFNDPYLIVYSQIAVDVFDVHLMEWVQTIPIKFTKMLSADGGLNLCVDTNLHAPRLVYFQNLHSEEAVLNIPQNGIHKYVTKRNDDSRRGTSESLRPVISKPHNFNHISHMGPGDGLQNLVSLPVRNPEEKPRAKSMYQHGGNHLSRQRPTTTIKALSEESASKSSLGSGASSDARNASWDSQGSLASFRSSSDGSPELTPDPPRQLSGEGSRIKDMLNRVSNML